MLKMDNDMNDTKSSETRTQSDEMKQHSKEKEMRKCESDEDDEEDLQLPLQHTSSNGDPVNDATTQSDDYHNLARRSVVAAAAAAAAASEEPAIDAAVQAVPLLPANQRTVESQLIMLKQRQQLNKSTPASPSPPPTPRIPIWMRSTTITTTTKRTTISAKTSANVSPSISSSSSTPSLTVTHRSHPRRVERSSSSTTLTRSASSASVDIQPSSSSSLSSLSLAGGSQTQRTPTRPATRPSTARTRTAASSSTSASSTRRSSISASSSSSSSSSSHSQQYNQIHTNKVVTSTASATSTATVTPLRAYLKRTSLASSFFSSHGSTTSRECDRDSLSLIFAFLSHTDFCTALRVSHHWLTIAQLPTAWPKLNIASLIAASETTFFTSSLAIEAVREYYSWETPEPIFESRTRDDISREVRIKYNIPLTQNKVKKRASLPPSTTVSISPSGAASLSPSLPSVSPPSPMPAVPSRKSTISQFASSSIFTRASSVALQISSKSHRSGFELDLDQSTSLKRLLSTLYDSVSSHMQSFRLQLHHPWGYLGHFSLISQLAEFLSNPKFVCLSLIDLPRLIHPLGEFWNQGFTYNYEHMTKISSLRVLQVIDDIPADIMIQFTQLTSLTLMLESSSSSYWGASPALIEQRWQRRMKTIEAVRRLANEHQLRVLELQLDRNGLRCIECLYKQMLLSTGSESVATVTATAVVDSSALPSLSSSSSSSPFSPPVISQPASLHILRLRALGEINLNELISSMLTLTELSIDSRVVNFITIKLPSNLKRLTIRQSIGTESKLHQFFPLKHSSSPHLESCRFYLTSKKQMDNCNTRFTRFCIKQERFDTWIRAMTSLTELELGDFLLLDGTSFDAMSACTQLRKLLLQPFHQSYLTSLLRTISRLTHLTTLQLTILPASVPPRSAYEQIPTGPSLYDRFLRASNNSPQQFVLTNMLLLQTIVTSTSWRVLRVHFCTRDATPGELANAHKPLWSPNLHAESMSLAQVLQSHPVASHEALSRRMNSFRLYHTSDLRDVDQVFLLDSKGTKRDPGPLVWKIANV